MTLQLTLWVALISFNLSNGSNPFVQSLQFMQILGAESLALACTTLVILCTFLPYSSATFSDLLDTSVRVSVPSVWLVPIYLLVSSTSPIFTALGLLLAANATRLLVTRQMSNRKGRREKSSKSEELLFTPPIQPKSAIAPALLGAIMLQVSLGAMLTGHPIAAVFLVCAASGTWTWAESATGGYRSFGQLANWPHLTWSALIALLLFNSISELNGGGMAGSNPIPGVGQSIAIETRLEDNGVSAPIPGGLRGVILRPKGKAFQSLRASQTAAASRLFAGRVLKFPFTGEYHLYPQSDAFQPGTVPVNDGTPLEASYKTLNGKAMVTEAIQEIYPPLDIRKLAKIQVILAVGENILAEARMQLIAKGKLLDLGTDIFGLVPAGMEETIEYVVPESAGIFQANELRLIFNRPDGRNTSCKVAIRSFTLLPRD